MQVTSRAENKQEGFVEYSSAFPVEVTRNLSAPIEKVWEAWSRAHMLAQWWGPETYTCPEARMDFREGGRYIFAMKGPNGVTKWSGGEYQYIVKYKKIVCTDRFMSKDGRVLTAQEFGFSGDWPRTLFIVVDFDRIGDCTTKINISHRGVPELMHENCIQGWNSTLNKLQKLVEKNGSSTSHIAT